MSQRRSYEGPVEFKSYPTGSNKTTAIAVGDLVYWDETNNVAVSAADFPWQGSEAATQRAFAKVFLGSSMDARGKTDSGNIRVAKWTAIRMPCSSATVEKDDWICPEKATGNALEAQKIQTTTDIHAAIGKALSSGTAQTSILFEACSAFDLPRPVGQREFLDDPGDAGAIPVSGYLDGVLPLVIGAGAETRTIADATYIGQRLTIVVQSVGGGSAAVTFSGGDITDTAGQDVATFDAAGEALVVEAAGNLKWFEVARKGATLA